MRTTLLVTLALFVTSSVVAAAPAGPAETAKLQRLSRDYWDDYLADNPGFATYIGDPRSNDKLYDMSERAYVRRYATARRFLARANAIDEQALTSTDRVTLAMLRRTLALALEGEPLHCYLEDNYLLPLNQMEGVHHRLLGLPDTHPFATARDYQTYLARLRAFSPQVDAVIENMRKGIALGVVHPRAVVERILPQLEAGASAAAKASPLYGPAGRFPKTVSSPERKRLATAIERTIATSVTPAFHRLLAFMRDEYLPKARTTFGLSALPRGAELYAYAIKVRTTTSLSADEIHALSLEELEKVELERARVVRALGFAGTPREFNEQLQNDREQRWFDAASVERDLRENLERIQPKLPQLFSGLPRVDYVLKPVEPFREASFPAGAFVPGTRDGSRAGLFLYNTHAVKTEGVRKYLLPDLAFHEVIPGHMLQANYASANQALPAFRRFQGTDAFNEGWASYAETLADELGAYPDVYARNFFLSARVFAEVSAIAETGIHAKGWSPEQAYAFVRRYLPMPQARFDVSLARWAALPAQGLSYGIGALKLKELRGRATRELGERFDVRDFHSVVLNNGNVPMDVLEGIVTDWVAKQKLR